MADDTTKEIFETALEALRAANPARDGLFKAASDMGVMLGGELQRMQVEQAEDLETFVAAKKADWDAHVSSMTTARATAKAAVEALKPKKK